MNKHLYRNLQGFRLAHLLWLALAIGFCLLLVFSGGSGHPPAMLLLPHTLAVWITGHLVLWGAGWLAARGRNAARAAGAGPAAWPPDLILLLVVTGIIGTAGLIQLAAVLLPAGWYPFPDHLWVYTLFAAFAHGVCFVALLLRRSWSRLLAALLCAGWALLMIWQIGEQLAHGHRVGLADWLSPS